MRHLPKIKIGYIYLASVLLFFISSMLGVFLGASDISLKDIFETVFGGKSEGATANIIRYVRLPRVLASLVCGAALAVSGAVLQSVLANRLASPSIIGVNSGAALAVTLSAAFGIAGGFRLSLFAFFGALVSITLISLGAKRWGASRGTVILMGVALNSLFGAISDTVITFVPDVTVMSNDFRVGDFSSVTAAKLIPAAILILISIAVLLTLSNELHILTLGDDNAKALGQNTTLMRTLFLILSALLAGAAVSIAGLLSFVGLIVPHIVRKTASSHPKHLLPLCALFGAGFVSLSDTLSRVIFAPYEVPVGIIMSFIGAPLFIFILIKGKGGHAGD